MFDTDNLQRTPMILGSQAGHPDVCTYLRRHANSSLKAKNTFGLRAADVAANVETRDELKLFTLLAKIFTLGCCGFQVSDLVADVTVTEGYAKDGFWGFFSIGLFFLLLCPVLVTIFDIRQWKSKEDAKVTDLLFNVLLNFTFTRIIYECFLSFKYGSKSGNLSISKMIESLFEAGPQATLQVYVMMYRLVVDRNSVISIVLSILNIGIAAASEGDFSALNITTFFSRRAGIVISFRPLEAVVRIITLALLFLNYRSYALACLAAEMMVMAIYMRGHAMARAVKEGNVRVSGEDVLALIGILLVNTYGIFISYDETAIDALLTDKLQDKKQLMGKVRARDFLALVFQRAAFNLVFLLMALAWPGPAADKISINSTLNYDSATMTPDRWKPTDSMLLWATIALIALPFQLVTAVVIYRMGIHSQAVGPDVWHFKGLEDMEIFMKKVDDSVQEMQHDFNSNEEAGEVIFDVENDPEFLALAEATRQVREKMQERYKARKAAEVVVLPAGFVKAPAETKGGAVGYPIYHNNHTGTDQFADPSPAAAKYAVQDGSPFKFAHSDTVIDGTVTQATAASASGVDQTIQLRKDLARMRAEIEELKRENKTLKSASHTPASTGTITDTPRGNLSR